MAGTLHCFLDHSALRVTPPSVQCVLLIVAIVRPLRLSLIGLRHNEHQSPPRSAPSRSQEGQVRNRVCASAVWPLLTTPLTSLCSPSALRSASSRQCAASAVCVTRHVQPSCRRARIPLWLSTVRRPHRIAAGEEGWLLWEDQVRPRRRARRATQQSRAERCTVAVHTTTSRAHSAAAHH